MLNRSLLAFLIASTTFGFAGDHGKFRQPRLAPQNSGTTQLLIAVSPVNSRVVWASGTGGTYLLTTDGGETWKAGVVPGAENLQFRDVQGVSDKVAYLLSIGDNPTDFRIYKTIDGGANWTTEFTNQTVGAFYDCFAFWTPERGLAHSDSVSGVFRELRTKNGTTWRSIADNMPRRWQAKRRFRRVGPAWLPKGRETHGSRLAVPLSPGSWPPGMAVTAGMPMTLRW